MLLILLIVILLAILLFDQPSPVPKVLVSNNSELLRHFTAPPFQRLGLELLVANSGAEERSLFDKQEPPLVVLDAETDGFATAKAVKEKHAGTRVILVAGKRLSGDQMREVLACGCDVLLIAPMTADLLHVVIAILLGEPRPGTEAFQIAIAINGRPVDATVSNLSIAGVRCVVAEPVTEGQGVEVTDLS